MRCLHAGYGLLDARHRQRRPLQSQRAAGAALAGEIHLVMRHQLAVQALAFAVDADVAGLGLCAAVVATGHADVQIRLAAGQHRAEQRARGEPQAAGGRAGARHHVVASPGLDQSEPGDANAQCRDLRLRHIEYREVLVLRRVKLVQAELLQHRSKAAQLFGPDIADGQRDGEHEQSCLLLREQLARCTLPWCINSIRCLPLTLRIRLVRQGLSGALELLAVFLQKALHAKTLDQELDARLCPFGAIGVFVVQRYQCFHRKQQFALGNEFLHHDGLARLVPQPAARPDPETGQAIPDRCDHAAIVQQRLRAIGLATGK